ncbi:uncharacterized protein LOC114915278 isoform X2 [Cajanus cajan]|nr:uncharacterized protein LOC114915278 isoform X2 [Cajanus cajan]
MSLWKSNDTSFRSLWRISIDSKNIPINFDNWIKVPKSYKDDCFNTLKASELIAKHYCSLAMSRKYRNAKMNMWNRVYDPSLSREQLITKVPNGIHKDQWSSFVYYHLRPNYQELCKKNTKVRKKQTIPHIDGAKLLSTKQHEMEQELGRVVGRGELYIVTHKKKMGLMSMKRQGLLG